MKQTKGTSPYITRPHHRVITVWTTNIYLPDTTKSAEKRLVETWDFGRYKPFLDSNSTHIPSVIEVHELETAQLRFDASGDYEIASARLVFLALPNENVAVLLEAFLRSHSDVLIDFMNELYERKLKLGGDSLAAYCQNALGVKGTNPHFFDQHYHQLVSISEGHMTDEIPTPLVREIVYRYYDQSMEFREEFQSDSQLYPPRLNLRKGSLCAVSPYVSVIFNHQGYIESSMILSILQCVSSQRVVAILRRRAFSILHQLRSQGFSGVGASKESTKVIELSKNLETLNLELSLSVEEPMNLSLILPSLRAEDYHQAIFAANKTGSKIDNISKIFTRIESVLLSNKNMFESYEQEDAAVRRNLFAFIASTISLFAIPVSIILAFLSTPIVEAPKESSIFDLNQHWLLYLASFGTVVVSFAFGVAIYSVLQFVKHRSRRRIFENIQQTNSSVLRR